MGSTQQLSSQKQVKNQSSQTTQAPLRWGLIQLESFDNLFELKNRLDGQIMSINKMSEEAACQMNILVGCENAFENQLKAMIQFSSTSGQDIKTNTHQVKEMLQQ